MKFNKTFAATFCLISANILLLAAAADAQDQVTPKPVVKQNNDRVKLRSGSGIDVRLIDEMKTENRSFVIFETENGGIVKLDQKYVSTVLAQDADQRRYAKMRDELPVNVEANWEIINWCKSQTRGRTKFKDQIQYHLENIIALDPNERKARQLLGYEDFNGQWSLKELRYRKYGYVRDNANWVPELVSKIEKHADQRDAQVASFREQFSKWNLEIRRSRMSAAELERMLYDVVTPESANFVFEEGGKKKGQPLVLRKMFVEAFGRTPARASAGALVFYAITDQDPELRERAITLLLQPEFDQDFAMSRMMSFLDSKNFEYSQRAGSGIGQLSTVEGADVVGVLMPLIDSLVSVREVPRPGATQAGRLNTGFDSLGGTSFSTGGGPQTIKKEVSNKLSLNALKLITGKDFGFNEELWRNYFVDTYTVSADGVRNDP